MNTKILDAVSTTSGGFGIVWGIANIQEVLGVVLLVVSIISTTATFIVRAIEWYKKAKDPKSDGGEKITAEEMKEGAEIVKDGAETIKEQIEKGKK